VNRSSPQDGLSLAKPVTFRLCHARAVANYRRTFICGGSFFFMANLAERRLRLPVDCIDLLRQAFRYVPRRHPFDIEATVVLPDHLTPSKAAEPMPSLGRFQSAAGKQQQGRSL
jgi:hypothetical protein